MTEGDSKISGFVHPDESDVEIVVEEDGRVAYAYLVVDGTLEADVWLWNVAQSPGAEEWCDPACDPPYANSLRFVDEASMHSRPPLTLSVAWCRRLPRHAVVKLGDAKIAALWPGGRPGWSRFAKHDGPLALAAMPEWAGNL